MEQTMGDKRKHKEDKGPESKKIKLTEPRDTDSSAQEACSSSEATPSRVGIEVVCQEATEEACPLKRALQQEEAARTGSCGVAETVRKTAGKENTKEKAVLKKQEEEDCKNDEALDQTSLKLDKSSVNELENEGKSNEKKDFLNVLSEDVAETCRETSNANRLFKRPRSAGSPRSPVDNISEKASCGPNLEDAFRCNKKLKIDELDEENPQLRSSSTDKEDSESEQTKEDEKTQCSHSQRNSLSDSAISPDSSEVKELNVVEFCRLTSFDHASVLNGNDISEQSSIKESACDEVFSEQPESCNKDNLNNVLIPFERDVFPAVEREAAGDFPRRRQRKKHIINAIQKLLEFYLSRGNLSKDKFLQEQMSPDGYVELTVFLSFNKVKCLTDELKLLKYAVKNSSVLELSNDEMRVKVKLGYHDKENELDCTVYVDYLPRTATRDWVSHYFTQFGDVDFVSLPLFKDSKRSRGFAFVEFRVPASAQLAIDSHENRHTAGNFGVGCSRISSSEISSEVQVYSSKYELLSAVPDSSSQGDDENSGKVDADILTEETLTTSTTTATATTACSEAESTIEASRNLLKNNVENGNGSGNDKLHNESNHPSESRGDKVPNPAEGEQPLQLSKRICKNSRPKRCTGKGKLVGPGLTDELLELLVVPKRAWMEGRKTYLSEQKKRLGMCKAIMAAERAQEEALKIEFDEPRPQKQMPVKVPGVVVKVTLDKPIVDKASLIVGIKSMGGAGVEFVDCSVGEKTFHVRFSSRESANIFRHTTAWKSKSSVIEGEEEDEFWERVQSSWTERITKPRIRKKKRGKDKINYRWQKRREALEGTCSDVLPSSTADQE